MMNILSFLLILASMIAMINGVEIDQQRELQVQGRKYSNGCMSLFSKDNPCGGCGSGSMCWCQSSSNKFGQLMKTSKCVFCPYHPDTNVQENGDGTFCYDPTYKAVAPVPVAKPVVKAAPLPYCGQYQNGVGIAGTCDVGQYCAMKNSGFVCSTCVRGCTCSGNGKSVCKSWISDIFSTNIISKHLRSVFGHAN